MVYRSASPMFFPCLPAPVGAGSLNGPCCFTLLSPLKGEQVRTPGSNNRHTPSAFMVHTPGPLQPPSAIVADATCLHPPLRSMSAGTWREAGRGVIWFVVVDPDATLVLA